MVKLTENIVCSRTKASALENIRRLNCWGCDLDDIEIMQQMPNLEVVSLSVNNITTLWPLSGCTKLEELYLRKNNIVDFQELRYLTCLQKLRVLWLKENPCSEHPHYRFQVLRTLPKLHTLDDRQVTPEELKAAKEFDQRNGALSENGALTQVEESCEYSPPECDYPSPEIPNVNNGIGWKTVRLPDRQQMEREPMRMVEMERHPRNSDNFSGMGTSFYVPNVSVESNGYGTPRNDGRNTSTSMTSLHDITPEVTTWQQQQAWQQQRNSAPRHIPLNSNQNNILVAISALLNELDRQGLEAVINEAEQRLRRF